MSVSHHENCRPSLVNEVEKLSFNLASERVPAFERLQNGGDIGSGTGCVHELIAVDEQEPSGLVFGRCHNSVE